MFWADHVAAGGGPLTVSPRSSRQQCALKGRLTNVTVRAKLPSLVKEAWPRHQEKTAKRPLIERPGGRSSQARQGAAKKKWFVQQPITGGFNQPPRLRPLRKLR